MIFASDLIMNKNDHEYKSETDRQNSMSLKIITAFGIILGSVGIAGSQIVLNFGRHILAVHRNWTVFGIFLFGFSFLIPLYALSLTDKDGIYSSVKETKNTAKRKLMLNRIAILLFLSAAGIFSILFLVS